MVTRTCQFGVMALVWTGCLSTQAVRKPLLPAYVIPFGRNEHDNIIVQAVLNEEDEVRLMLHTAVDSLSLTTAALERGSSVELDSSAKITSWGGSRSTRHSSSNSLRIGNLSWEGLAITEDTHSGPGSDGKFGCNLFTDWIMEIDYARGELLLHEMLPGKATAYDRIPLEVEGSNLFVPATVVTAAGAYENRYLLHSGFGGALLFDDVFAQEHQLDVQLPLVGERELRDSLGNVLKTRKVRVPTLRVGSTEIEDVAAEFFAGAIGRRKMSVFGCNLLARFSVLLDIRAGHIYLKPQAAREEAADG